MVTQSNVINPLSNYLLSWFKIRIMRILFVFVFLLGLVSCGGNKESKKDRRPKLEDMTLSAKNPFENLKGSGLETAKHRDLPELIDIFKKNKTSVLNAMKNTGMIGWKGATMKNMDGFIADLQELMANPGKCLDSNNRFSPVKSDMSSKSKAMLIGLPVYMFDDIVDSVEYLGKRQKEKEIKK